MKMLQQGIYPISKIEQEYRWQDHMSHQQERASVSAVEFIRRLAQHILPRGFQRVRYYGLHAVSIRGQILEPVRRAIGAALQLPPLTPRQSKLPKFAVRQV